MKRQNNPTCSQRGMSLVELMVSLTIGLLILGGVLVVYTSSSQAYRVTDNTSRLQEGARLAFEFLRRDIRMAGFMGCFSDFGTLNIRASTPPTFTAASVLQGQAGTDFTNGVTDTGALTVRRAANSGVNLRTQMSIETGVISIRANTPGISANDLVFVSDCLSADLICVESITGTGPFSINHDACNTSNAVNRRYGPDAVVSRYVQNSYFIRQHPTTGLPTLSRIPWNGSAVGTVEDLVEGVYDMQILYGEDTNNDGAVNAYVNAGAVGNWPNVLSVRITLSLRTQEDGIATSAQTYTYNGTSVTDRRIRRDFTSTIALRTRNP